MLLRKNLDTRQQIRLEMGASAAADAVVRCRGPAEITGHGTVYAVFFAGEVRFAGW